MNKTKTENKLYPKDKKPPYPLLITGTPTRRVLYVINPQTGELMYSSTFHESKFLQKYESEEDFRAWFDYAVQVSVQERIIHGMFRALDALPDMNSQENAIQSNISNEQINNENNTLDSQVETDIISTDSESIDYSE